jgi:putative ATP-dependent endonuclease of OLD family
VNDLKAMMEEDLGAFSDRCDSFGVFTNFHTLEVDLFNEENLTKPIIETLCEQEFGAVRQGWIDGWEADPKSLNVLKYLSLIDSIGKGRFAQRLASRVKGIEPPDYIKSAIKFVVNRV